MNCVRLIKTNDVWDRFLLLLTEYDEKWKFDVVIIVLSTWLKMIRDITNAIKKRSNHLRHIDLTTVSWYFSSKENRSGWHLIWKSLILDLWIIIVDLRENHRNKQLRISNEKLLSIVNFRIFSLKIFKAEKFSWIRQIIYQRWGEKIRRLTTKISFRSTSHDELVSIVCYKTLDDTWFSCYFPIRKKRQQWRHMRTVKEKETKSSRGNART